jgi:hypothetical protein
MASVRHYSDVRWRSLQDSHLGFGGNAMRHSKFTVVVLLALAGCQSSGGTGGSSAATGQIVSAGGMPDFCRQQASSQLGPSLENISTSDPVSTGSGTSIRGQWTDPNTGDTVGTFECQFGSNGAFQGVSQI